MKISEHFSLSEFKHIPLKELVRRNCLYCVELLRLRLNRDLCTNPYEEIVIIITSGVRTPKENEKVGGSPTSKHLNKYGGHALDFIARHSGGKDIPPEIVAQKAQDLFDFIKPYPEKGHTHVDQRDRYEERVRRKR